MTEVKKYHRKSNCEIHGEFEDEGIKPFSSIIWQGCVKCAAERQAADNAKQVEIKNFEAQQKRQSFYSDAGIMRRYQGLTLANFSPKSSQMTAFDKASTFVNNFDAMARKGQTVIYNGSTGTGKTRLVQAMIQTLGFGEYIRAVDISRRVRATYSASNKSEESEIRKFVDSKCLIIDEVGVQAGTESEKNLISDIIDRRYGDMRPTVICSNLDTKELAESFGERAWDRLYQNCVICPMTGPSQRNGAN